MEEKIFCRVLTGPTGSGKSDLALRLAEEKGWEILCMDSMQIYRRLDIGTAKPSAEERRRVPHHLLDVCAPGSFFTMADFQRLAYTAIDDILSLECIGQVPDDDKVVDSANRGMPVVEWNTTNGNLNALGYRYVPKGASSLTQPVNWQPTSSAHRFFKVFIEPIQ